MIEFLGKNKVINFVLEEESVTIPESTHTIAFDEASKKPPQDIVEFYPTQDDLVIHEEKT